jgi:hypothetical protein
MSLALHGAQMEPGSGSTIMGYAGITNANVQMNSDAYFHVKNIEEVQTYVNSKPVVQLLPPIPSNDTTAHTKNDSKGTALC